MQLRNTILFFTSLVAAAPNTPILSRQEWSDKINLAIREAEHQGDGLYLANINDEGNAVISFTPLAELPPVTDEELAHYEARVEKCRVERSLEGRSDVVTCSGRGASNLDDLNRANIQAANNAKDDGYYSAGSTGWVYIGNENSFFCNYNGQTWDYDLMIDRHIAVSAECGQAGYGYQRCRPPSCGSRIGDASVGRTWYGDHYC